MSYCPNCGKKRIEFENFCEACGYSFRQSDKVDEKDKKIQELEEKVNSLENLLSQKNQDSSKNMSPWIFIFPLCFFIIFFGFFFLLVTFR
jgi:uncharacterized membrane protein YvbJ